MMKTLLVPKNSSMLPLLITENSSKARGDGGFIWGNEYIMLAPHSVKT